MGSSIVTSHIIRRGYHYSYSISNGDVHLTPFTPFLQYRLIIFHRILIDIHQKNQTSDLRVDTEILDDLLSRESNTPNLCTKAMI